MDERGFGAPCVDLAEARLWISAKQSIKISMARIRTIKPEFFRHEELFEAEKATGLPLRIAYAGLWTVADREGRFRWKPRVLVLDVLPFDDVDFGDVLNELAAHGFLVKYQVDGEVFAYIPTFTEHQHVNVREPASNIPAPDEAGARTCENIPARARARAEEGKGREGKGDSLEPRERANEPLSRVEFGQVFWPEWPNKVGQRAAVEAFITARRKATLDTIMDGVRRYAREKPPDRQWMNPATFLDEERWTDEPAPAPSGNTKDRPHDAIFRTLARHAQEGGGDDERSAGTAVRFLDQPRPAG